MINTVFNSLFCSFSIITNSDTTIYIVDDDLQVYKSYDFIDEFAYNPMYVVYDYIKLVCKTYKHTIMRAYRNKALADFLESDFYKQAIAFAKENDNWGNKQ